MTTIKSIELQDFKGMHKVSVSFDDNITYLIGNNGDGKTSIGLDGIQFIFQGISEKKVEGQNPILGKRFNFISDGATSAKGYAILHDEVKGDIQVKRKVTATTNTVEFEAKEGIILDQKWLNDLFNFYMISPRSFIRLTPKEQAKVIGIDLSKFDNIIKELKTKYTEINFVIRSMGDIGCEPEKINPISISDKVEELRKATDNNKLIEAYNENITNAKKKIQEYEEAIKKYQTAIKQFQDYIDKSESPGDIIDISIIQKEISEAEDINTKSRIYDEWNKKNVTLLQHKEELRKNQIKQEDILQERLVTLQKMELPFKNLNINEDGELILDGRHLNDNFFSTGELMTIVPILMSKVNYSKDKMKYVYIQDFSLIDKNNQIKIIDYLTKEGFQIVAEVVDENPIKGKHCIILKEGKVLKQINEL